MGIRSVVAKFDLSKIDPQPRLLQLSGIESFGGLPHCAGLRYGSNQRSGYQR